MTQQDLQENLQNLDPGVPVEKDPICYRINF